MQNTRKETKVKLVTEEKAVYQEGTDPLAPTMGRMPDVCKELQGSQCDRGDGERAGEEVEVTAEG